jgi:hypothetical protein
MDADSIRAAYAGIPPYGAPSPTRETIFDDWLRAEREKAWDEGYNSRWDNAVISRSIDNPYRHERLDAQP